MFVYVALVDMMVKCVLIVAHWELDCGLFFSVCMHLFRFLGVVCQLFG